MRLLACVGVLCCSMLRAFCRVFTAFYFALVDPRSHSFVCFASTVTHEKQHVGYFVLVVVLVLVVFFCLGMAEFQFLFHSFVLN